MIAYMGDLEVEGAEFSLRADRMIVREDEIAFELSGNCRSGDFRIDGVAYKQSEGDYVSIPLPVIYIDYPDSGDLAVVNFDKIVQSPKKQVCKVSGGLNAPSNASNCDF